MLESPRNLAVPACVGAFIALVAVTCFVLWPREEPAEATADKAVTIDTATETVSPDARVPAGMDHQATTSAPASGSPVIESDLDSDLPSPGATAAATPVPLATNRVEEQPGGAPSATTPRAGSHSASQGSGPEGATGAATAGSAAAAAVGQVSSPLEADRGQSELPAGLDDAEPPTDPDLPLKSPRPDEEDVDDPLPPVVRMIPTAADYGVGQRISVVVEIASGTDVGHVPFHVVFDPQILTFESGEEGPYLGGDGRQTAFFASLASDGARVVVGLSRLGRGDGIDGPGQLCVLNFSAVGTGTTALGFASAKVRNSANQIVPAQFLGAAVNVQ